MAYSATSKCPWKINVRADGDAKLSLPDVLPDVLMQSAHIQFNFDFRPECYGLAIQAHDPHVLFKLIQEQQRLERLFQAVHYVGCGIDEICRRLSEVPVKRNIEICWSDCEDTTDLDTTKTVLQPLSRLGESCLFRLGVVSDWQDESRQKLASYMGVVTGRNSIQ